jgi:hypothetical protein
VSGLQDIGDLGFLCLMGILTPLQFFFRYLEMTYPPIFKCSESNDVKKFTYTITIWKIWGGLTFESLVDFSGESQNLNVWTVQFIMLIGDTPFILKVSRACPFIFKACDVNVGIFVKTSTSQHHIVFSL